MHGPIFLIIAEGVEVAGEDAYVIILGVRPLILEEVDAPLHLRAPFVHEPLDEVLILEAAARDVRAHHISRPLAAAGLPQLGPHHRPNHQLPLAAAASTLEVSVARDLDDARILALPAAAPSPVQLVAQELIVVLLGASPQGRRIIVDHLPDRLRLPLLPGADDLFKAYGCQHIFRCETLLHSNDIRRENGVVGPQRLLQLHCGGLLIFRIAGEILQVEGHDGEPRQRS
mmetsp:Transcript_89266/g.257455  ORF Transcript_89266/g.257455 Transcript_89266/m.257455 type:complete len:229 (+) Transcript_89266:617-1303(+)